MIVVFGSTFIVSDLHHHDFKVILVWESSGNKSAWLASGSMLVLKHEQWPEGAVRDLVEPFVIVL